MEPLSILRRALGLYMAALAVLGVGTLAWAVANVVILDNVTLATLWFGVAGAGTLLTVALILRYYLAGGEDPVPAIRARD